MSAATTTAPQPFYTNAMCTIALWSSVVIVDAAGAIDTVRMGRLFDAYEKVLARPVPQVFGFCIIRPGVPVSSSEARAEATRRTKELGGGLAHVALVTEDAAAGGLLLRAAVRGYSMLTRSTKVSYHASVPDAVQALAPMVATSGSRSPAEELQHAVAAVRASFRPSSRTHRSIRS